MRDTHIKAVDNLLQKKVTRREFFEYFGAAVLAATGVYGLIKLLTSQQDLNQNPMSYGSGIYGGKKKS